MERPRARLVLASLTAWSIAGCSDNPDLVEDRSVYDDDSEEVLVVELTIDDLAGLAAVEANVPGAEVAAIVRAGSVGADATSPNATVELRGKSSRRSSQKSYKVKLRDGGARWRGQRELNLNKHPYDLTRVRQKVCLDLFRSVDHVASLRTQLVHLFINGEDRGLYTHVEEPDELYLASHGLDPDGALYKAELFWFAEIDDVTAGNPELLDHILEARANPDSEKLRRMLDAVNDPWRDINDVVGLHFNRENYLTWLAVNLLVGNFDTRSQNFLLYSPSGVDGWYFLPWDYDGALDWNQQPGNSRRPRWMAGLGTYWGITLHERFLRDPANVADLTATMDRLRSSALSDAALAAALDRYRDLVEPYVMRPPDLASLPTHPHRSNSAITQLQWEAEYDRLYGAIDALDDEFDAVYQRPMPVWLWHQILPDEVLFFWSPSYELDGRAVTYDFMLSTSPDFEPTAIVAQRLGLTDLTTVEPRPPPGTYYWRVISRSENRPFANWQLPLFELAHLTIP